MRKDVSALQRMQKHLGRTDEYIYDIVYKMLWSIDRPVQSIVD